VRAKTSELLWGYIKQFKGLLCWGFLFNILGMVGEFASPLFIGLVIDAIVKGDQDEVVFLIVVWMIINTVSYWIILNLFLGRSLIRWSLEIHLPIGN
jgi:ABC-type multidrug transport system fused ATPase/permease subunit